MESCFDCVKLYQKTVRRMNEDREGGKKKLACLPVKRHKQTELRYARQHVSYRVRLSVKLVRYIVFIFIVFCISSSFYFVPSLHLSLSFLRSLRLFRHSMYTVYIFGFTAVKRDWMNVCLCVVLPTPLRNSFHTTRTR